MCYTCAHAVGFPIPEIDLAKALPVKRIHDVVGYYNRFDIFSLKVNKAKNLPIDICNAAGEHAFLPQDAVSTNEHLASDALTSGPA